MQEAGRVDGQGMGKSSHQSSGGRSPAWWWRQGGPCPGRVAAHFEGLGVSLEGWARSGLHGAHRMGLGGMEPGQGAC